MCKVHGKYNMFIPRPSKMSSQDVTDLTTALSFMEVIDHIQMNRMCPRSMEQSSPQQPMGADQRTVRPYARYVAIRMLTAPPSSTTLAENTLSGTVVFSSMLKDYRDR